MGADETHTGPDLESNVNNFFIGRSPGFYISLGIGAAAISATAFYWPEIRDFLFEEYNQMLYAVTQDLIHNFYRMP